MVSNGVLTLMVIFSLLVISIDALYKYDILFREEDVFSACDIPNVHYIDEYIDRTNITSEFQDDGTLVISGSDVVIKDGGTQNIPLEVEVFKKTRGDWVNTIYSVRRPDICTAVFDPTEFWYMFFESIKDKTCPGYKGQTFYKYAVTYYAKSAT